MHAFVASVLLRKTRLDPFDAQAQPRDGSYATVFLWLINNNVLRLQPHGANLVTVQQFARGYGGIKRIKAQVNEEVNRARSSTPVN